MPSFPIVNTCLSCKDIAQERCAMVRRRRSFGDFLRPVFPASRVQHISDLHSKFAMCGSMVDIQFVAAGIRQGKKETRMWADAQRDGRPAEYRWRPLFNAAMFG